MVRVSRCSRPRSWTGDRHPVRSAAGLHCAAALDDHARMARGAAMGVPLLSSPKFPLLDPDGRLCRSAADNYGKPPR